MYTQMQGVFVGKEGIMGDYYIDIPTLLDDTFFHVNNSL